LAISDDNQNGEHPVTTSAHFTPQFPGRKLWELPNLLTCQYPQFVRRFLKNTPADLLSKLFISKIDDDNALLAGASQLTYNFISSKMTATY
jgi:hypothetical protein